MSTARLLLLLFRWGIFLLACAHIYAQLTSAKGNRSIHALAGMLKGTEVLLMMGLVLLLMVCNWAIESIKWHALLRPFARISRWRAFLGTIAGTSLALISPNRTGEFVGRVMFLAPGERIQGAVATMLGGIAQFIITLAGGALAMLLLSHVVEGGEGSLTGPMLGALAFLAVSSALAALFLFFEPSVLLALALKIPFARKWHGDLAFLLNYPRRRLAGILGLSLLRYCIFTGQFVLLLVLFAGIPSIKDGLLSVPVIFLVSALIPTVLLTELGVRGTVALAILAPTGASEAGILLATFTIWLVNLMLPAIIGSLILLAARIRMRGEGP